MAMGASFIAFVFACAAAGATLFLGFSFIVAVLVYSGVGALGLLLAVLIADTLGRNAPSVSDAVGHRAIN